MHQARTTSKQCWGVVLGMVGKLLTFLENGVDSHGMTVDKVADTNALGKLSYH